MARFIQKILLLVAAASCVIARSPTPRFPYDPNTTPHCTWWVNYDGSQTCTQILDSGWITIEEFRRWNPSIGANCAGLQNERSYCIEALDEPDPPPTTATTRTTSTTTSASTTTTTGNGVNTPLPTQPSMVNNCARFYFVPVDESCAAIASQHGISQQQFLDWNPSVGPTCSGLWANVYVCVGTIGMTTTTAPPPTTTTTPPGNGVTTPLPIQPDMVGNCERFYFVRQDETCATIASAHGITQQQFRTWNPSVGATCSGLWANVYVCVGLIGQSPPTTTTTTRTTTTAGNGISTPVPTQPGMVSNCDRFHLVRSGDSCASIGAANNVRSDRITDWNTSAGPTCSGLWADAYVCVRTIGFTPSTTTSCSSHADDKLWGGNQQAALDSVVLWCNGDSSTDGSGGFVTGQRKSGCYNAPLGTNRFEFGARNDFGAGATLSVAKCNELMTGMINSCQKGGTGRQEGWWFSAYVRAGRC